MNRLLNNALYVAVVCVISLNCGPVFAGVISGTVESTSGEPTNGALVFITEAELGLPLNSDGTTSPKLGSSSGYPSAVRTGVDGAFEFEMPDGTYNLFAQYYRGDSAQIERPPFNANLPVKQKSIFTAGRVRNITVPSEAAGNVRLKPAGTGTIKVRFEAGGYSDVAVLSTSPPSLDPVFGFAGWMGDFLKHAFAFNLVPLGKTDFHNVPAGPVYIAVFGNDNLPGFGVAHVDLEDGQTTTVSMQLVASWSNGRKTPPPELLELYQKFEKNKWTLKDVSTLPKLQFKAMKPGPAQAHHALVEENPSIQLPDGSQASARDVWTVLLYRQLNQ